MKNLEAAQRSFRARPFGGDRQAHFEECGAGQYHLPFQLMVGQHRLEFRVEHSAPFQRAVSLARADERMVWAQSKLAARFAGLAEPVRRSAPGICGQVDPGARIGAEGPGQVDIGAAREKASDHRFERVAVDLAAVLVERAVDHRRRAEMLGNVAQMGAQCWARSDLQEDSFAERIASSTPS